MFAVLVSSSPRREHSWLARGGSAGLHGLLIAAAALAGGQSRPERTAGIRDTTIFAPLEPARVKPRPHLHRVTPRPGVPVLRFSLQPVLPDPIPGPAPSPDPALIPGSDPRPGSSIIGTDSGGPMLVAPIDARHADEPPSLIEHPVPRYPELLRSAGIEGSAVVEVVLDTLGSVEPATVRVLSETHPMFGAEARFVILASRYRPARLGGRAVRVRIRVPVSFRLRG